MADGEAGDDQHKLDCSQCGQARGRGEQQREIFGPAFAELGETAIHAGSDGVASEAKEYLSARALDGASQSHIFEQASGDCGVSSDGIVGFARDQDVLPVGSRGGRLWVAHLRGAIACGKLGEDHGHDSFFPEAFHDLLGRIREQGCAVALRFCEAAGQRSRQVDGVRIGEQEPFAAGRFGSGGDGVVLAGPACGELHRLRSLALGRAGKDEAISRVRSVE